MFWTVRRIIDWAGARKRRIWLGCLCSFLQTLCVAIPVMVAAYAIQAFFEAQKYGEILPVQWAEYAAIGMAAAVLGRFLFSYLRVVAQESIGYEVTAEQRLELGNVLKHCSLSDSRGRKSAGAIASALTNDLSLLERFAMKMVDVVLNGYVNAGALIVCLGIYFWQAAVLAAVGIAASSWALQQLGNMSKQNAQAHQIAQDALIAVVLEYIRGIAVVRAFKQEGLAQENFARACRQSKEVNIQIEKSFVPYNCLHLLALKGAATFLLAMAALLVLKGDMTESAFIVVAFFSFSLFKQVEKINNAAHLLELLAVTLDKLENLRAMEPLDANGEEKNISDFTIEFEKVNFSYDTKKVLERVSFSAVPNAVTAIVGPSGSGKTTIFNLLARFYDTDDGYVRIGGIDIKSLSCESLLQHISMVFQQVYLFHDTIFNNICFGKQGASREEVIAAAQKARCHDFIMQLPDGYNTMVGEGGATLSGGEKQRISIARAILKDASIILFDEATASLDPENECLIQEAVSELAKGKTVVVIAHRLATIRHAACIIVLEKGHLVQMGTHEELAAQPGLYQRFLKTREEAEGWSLS